MEELTARDRFAMAALNGLMGTVTMPDKLNARASRVASPSKLLQFPRIVLKAISGPYETSTRRFMLFNNARTSRRRAIAWLV